MNVSRIPRFARKHSKTANLGIRYTLNLPKIEFIAT